MYLTTYIYSSSMYLTTYIFFNAHRYALRLNPCGVRGTDRATKKGQKYVRYQ